MSDLVMQLAGVIQHDMDTLREVAQNVANANTPGYKAARSFNTLSAAATASAADAGQAGAASAFSRGLGSIERQGALRQDTGALQQTGRALDFAISGDAWFVVQTEQGEQLTRDGRFRVDADGRLVTQAGHAVQGLGGVITPGQGELTVDATGLLRVNGDEVAQFRLVRASDPSALQVVGGGRYQSARPLLLAQNYAVHQGRLERSNAELGADMVKIMEASRHVESMQRALSAYDSMLNSGINQLGKD